MSGDTKKNRRRMRESAVSEGGCRCRDSKGNATGCVNKSRVEEGCQPGVWRQRGNAADAGRCRGIVGSVTESDGDRRE